VDNQRVRRDGHYFQIGGDFAWWPTSTYSGKPWPKEVPVLCPENFKRGSDDPDCRLIEQWVDGFPFDFPKIDKVIGAIKQAAKELSLRGFGGSYNLWRWGDKQSLEDLARVWNRAMEILGYTERVGS
jgi:hypothetical protein